MGLRGVATVTAAALLAGLAPARAVELNANTQVQAGTPASGWSFRLTPYLWFAGFTGTIGARGSTADIDAPFRDVFDELNFGAMVNFEARKNRFVTLVDGFYASLGDERSISVPSGLSVEANSKTLVLNPDAGFRLLGGDKASVDFLAGIRYWHLKNSLEFQSEVLPATPKISGSKSWVDPVLGAQVGLKLPGRWRARLQGDAGGFGAGSDLTWQVVATLGYEISNRTVLNAGYRYLDVDYRSGGFRFDTAISGLLLGVSFRF
jgi:opacity protein-like surface antigen